MKRGVVGSISVILAILIIIPLIQAVQIDPEVLQKISYEEDVSVIVVLKDQPVPERRVGIASAQADYFSRRKEMISEAQDEVLGKLKVRERGKDKISGLGIASVEDYDFELRHRYSIINGFSGKLTREGLDKLIASGQVEKVEFDRPVRILLDGSVPQINANDVWNITVNGTAINGSGETVCVIDTGVDYTHPA